MPLDPNSLRAPARGSSGPFFDDFARSFIESRDVSVSGNGDCRDH
jgi:hypothetical protein